MFVVCQSSLVRTCAPLFVLFFFFAFFGVPRDPHSFPTRRSSDLLPPHVHAVRDLAHHRSRVQAMAASMKAVIVSVDRKSTRLNSSHRCISYAVFCLKKKNNKQC